MLSDNERMVLVSYVVRQLPNGAGVQAVEPFVGREIAAQTPNTVLIIQLAEWIVEQALIHPEPAILIKVVRQVDDGSANLAPLLIIVERLEADPASWESSAIEGAVDWGIDHDPTEVDDGKPFIDRVSFRQLLPRLTTPVQTPMCTVIAGSSGSGKTYLYRFCSHFAARCDELKVGFTKVGSSGIRRLSPYSLAIELASDLGTDLLKIPRQHEDPHRHARNLVAWILQYTPQRRLPALAIFDGFDHPDVPPAVHTFIDGFLLALQNNPDAQTKLRAVLLGYDVGRLERESIRFNLSVLEHVGPAEISTWFRRRFPGLPDYQYEDATAEIHNNLPNGEQRMRTLCNMAFASQGLFERGEP